MTPHISAHVIDRASLRCLGLWKLTCYREEGLHTWLQRKAEEALSCPTDHRGRHMYIGLLWVFADGEDGRPVLKTIIRDGG